MKNFIIGCIVFVIVDVGFMGIMLFGYFIKGSVPWYGWCSYIVGIICLIGPSVYWWMNKIIKIME